MSTHRTATGTPAVIEPCPQQLSPSHREQYQELGYVALEGVLHEDEVAAARDALSQVTRGLMRAARQGDAEVHPPPPGATQNYAGLRVVRTGTSCAIHFEAGVDPLSLPVESVEQNFRKLHAFHAEHEVFVSMVEHRRIKGFLADLIGQELILKDEMALCKPPYIGSEKPWHQDNAYFNHLPLELVGTAWIALDDATVENGCMHVLPGQHRRGPLRHHHTIDCEILADRLDPALAVPVPLQAGGVLYFSAMLPHQTPPNHSPALRRALQFQYRGVDTRPVSKEEYGQVFAEADGRPASCALAHETG